MEGAQALHTHRAAAALKLIPHLGRLSPRAGRDRCGGWQVPIVQDTATHDYVRVGNGSLKKSPPLTCARCDNPWSGR
jgi:hypothetical protein